MENGKNHRSLPAYLELHTICKEQYPQQWHQLDPLKEWPRASVSWRFWNYA
jgi:hypothetical protein